MLIFIIDARGRYVDVMGGTSKAAATPSSLFSVLPKSASMPASIFVPNAMGQYISMSNALDRTYLTNVLVDTRNFIKIQLVF